MPARGDTVFLVIGEDDCHVTWRYGFDAIGVSAPHDFVPDRDDSELDGYDVIALPGRDAEGDALVERLSLSRHSDRIRVTRLNGFASVASAHLQGAERIDLLDSAKNNAVALDAFLAERSELDKQKYPERAEILLKAGERHKNTATPSRLEIGGRPLGRRRSSQLRSVPGLLRQAGHYLRLIERHYFSAIRATSA